MECGNLFFYRPLGFCSEVEGQKLDSELLKMLSGGDSIAIEPKFKDAFSSRPSHVLLFMSNGAPEVEAYSDPLKRRIVAYPFKHKLDRKTNPLLGGKDLNALAGDPSSDLIKGFLNWALEGLERFVDENYQIHQAKVVKEETLVFWKAVDKLTPFWEALVESNYEYTVRYTIRKTSGEQVEREEKVNLDFDRLVPKADLRRVYETWCDVEGVEKRYRVGRKTWTQACRSVGLMEWRVTSVKGWVRNPNKGPSALFPEIPKKD